MSIKIAVEIYKKKYPPAQFEFFTRMQNEVYVGGDLQAAVNLVAASVAINTDISRLQTLKIAIKGCKEVSVLPLVYMYTMADCVTGVMNSFPRSEFRIKDSKHPRQSSGYVRYGEHEPGSSERGAMLKPHSDRIVLLSCDPLSVKDPRLDVMHANCPSAFPMDSYQQQEHQQHVFTPKWSKAFCIDMIADIYRSIRYEMVQPTPHRPGEDVLKSLYGSNKLVQSSLPAGTRVQDPTPLLSYLCTTRNCIDSMEAIASEIVSAHILSQDLIPPPFSFYRYILPTLYHSRSPAEARQLLSLNPDGDSVALAVTCDITLLLSAQTKKKAR